MRRGLAVITGASAGIGKAFAKRLVADGYRVLLVARRRDRLTQLAAELGPAAEAFPADLVDAAELRRVEDEVATRPGLSLLVNNAGFGLAGRFFDISADDHERMHRLHVIATLRLTHAALRRMISDDTGAVSSVAGFTVSPGSIGYAATKHWMNVFTEGLWLDLRTRGSNVRVQALCPGFTYSEFHDVMGMDRSRVPANWWTSAETVVNASIRGLERNQIFVVPGWRYRVLTAALRVIPAPLIRAGSSRFARRLKRT
jgi:uncharacterized protein